ncbi:MAG: hypothetical protein COA44_01395 [Arcobacter sp.]|nr:MAG: hypothetical protein COA44_01395 [Arcobacter sp.]
MFTENYYYHDKNQFKKELETSKLLNKKNLLIQIFISIRPKEEIQEISKNIQKCFPLALIIGATTDGEILGTKVTTDGVVVSISSFDKSTLRLGFIQNSEKDSDSFSMGQELASQLVEDTTKVMILFTDGLNTNGEDFLKGIEAWAPHIVIAGGMAGDAARFENTFIIAQDKVISNGAVGVAIDSTVLSVMTNYSFNWHGIGRKMRVDKAEKNRVYRIDGKSAVDVYKHYLGKEVADKLPAIGIEFPMIVNRNGLPVARAVLKRLEDDSLVFAGNINEGDIVQLGFGNIDMILESANSFVMAFSGENVESCFIYSCMARRRFLQDDIKVELSALNELSSLSGFFTYGEFYKDVTAQLLNETMTVLALSESEEAINILDVQTSPVSQRNEFQSTLTALAHLINQTSYELEELNESLEQKVKDKTLILQQKLEELELVTRVKSDFLANMSHEIRTPLNAILGFIKLLSVNETDADKIKQFGIVQDSGESLVHIINDVLDFSKIESGKLEIDNHSFITKKPFQDISLLFTQKAEENNIKLSVCFSQDIPFKAYGDELRIKQVLSNLLSNAIKFTPKNGSIDVNVSYDLNHLYCCIEDTGIGISQEQQTRIFGAFSQADTSTTRKFGGTGLGLSISSRLVQMMKGELGVTSSLDKGSVFSFTLPIFGHDDKEDTLGLEEEIEEKTMQSLKGQVLIVEDNKANQMLMKIFLEEMGIESVIAENGLLGFESFRTQKFDAILMDENMPVMNGIESTQKIRAYEKEHSLEGITIIAVTANALNGDKEKFLESGMDDYITKPVDVQYLKTVLSKYLKEKR